MSDILMAFKSTLDNIVTSLAEELSAADIISSANPVRSFDLDDNESNRQVQAGAEHALVYQYITLAPDPRHPLYEANFLVGAKTTDDEGNYDLTTLLNAVTQHFREDTFFDLYDWSEADTTTGPPTEILGCMMIINAVPAAQMFENQAGIRMLQITAKVMG